MILKVFFQHKKIYGGAMLGTKPAMELAQQILGLSSTHSLFCTTAFSTEAL